MILIKNVHIYVPKDLGIQDILIGENKILCIQEHIETTPYMEVIDGSNLVLTPGFIDRHVHVIGGGGEGGFATRTPELQLSSCIQAGITTVVGLLGTDGISRSVEDLIAKVKALKDEGLSAYAMTGSYAYPSTTITGSIEKDIMFIEEILGVKLALSDHRSSHISYEHFLEIASKTRTAGMFSKKAGCITLHLGDEEQALDYVLKAIKETGLPSTLFHPTHVTRNKHLFQQSLELLAQGGTIDITSEPHKTSAAWIQQANPKDYERITLSSDGQGSWSTYDSFGKLTAIGVSDVSILYHDVISMIRNKDFSIETCLSFVTTNPAKALGLYPTKGCIEVGSDADLLLFSKDFTLHSVLANGKWFMKEEKILKKGMFE